MRAALGLLLVACASSDLPPRGEALVVVDTDLPVPRVISRLRIDVLAEDGSIVSSREDLRPDPRDWPVSFSVYTDDENAAHRSWIRLRAFPDRTDPDPRLVVDRRLRVTLVPGTRGRVVVTLRGACAGKASTQTETCIDADVISVEDTAVESSLSREVTSALGTYGAHPCSGENEPGRVCVPGGSFVLGDAFFRPTEGLDPRPERIVSISRFAMDIDEVSVGRYRGFVGKYAPGTADDCTFRPTAGQNDDQPLNCVPWLSARAFCQARGGDLPTEAQWEYAAVAANRVTKSLYPWGDETPSCDRAVYSRAFERACGASIPPLVPPSPDANALGIRNLAGSMSEMMLDDHRAGDGPCFASAVDPVCLLPITPACAADPTSQECRFAEPVSKTVRGGSWASSALDLRIVDRSQSTNLASDADQLAGFRCVYPAP